MFMLFNKFLCSSSNNNKQSNDYDYTWGGKMEKLLKKLNVDADSLFETKMSYIKAMHNDVANLLITRQLNNAHTLPEYLIDHENLCIVLLLIRSFSSQLAFHLFYIETQRIVPTPARKAIASLCYAGSWYHELPALDKILSQLSLKYGEKYLARVNKFKEDYAVDKELLSVPKPTLEERNILLKEVSDKFGLYWDSVSVTGTEFFASEHSMSSMEAHTMLRLFNKIPCSSNKQFNLSTCKTLLEKAIADAESLVNATENEMDGIREDIFKVLVKRQTRFAYSLAESLLDKRNLCVVLRYITYFCQQVAHHLPYIESRRKVLPEVKESIDGLCYIGSRCSKLPELKMLVSQFSLKYGEDYISKVNMLMEDGVKEKIISLFIPKPLVEERNNLVKKIAVQFGLKERLIEEQNKRIKKVENRLRLVWDQVYADKDTMASAFDEDMSSSSDEGLTSDDNTRALSPVHD